MLYNAIMITYLAKLGELTLKGSNLKEFENQLLKNTQFCLRSFDSNIMVHAGRMYIDTPESSASAVEYTLKHLIGITGWAKVRVCEKNIAAIKEAVYKEGIAAKKNGAATFKIEARREDKKFELTSYEICRQAAGPLFDDGTLGVDVHKPDVTINVEVRERCFVFTDSTAACRGLPVGVSGKGLLLLSGGLDSPVAGYRMMRRGMNVECIYFHSYPYTSEEAQKKVEKLAALIADYGLTTHLNIIPFTAVQMRIKQRAPVPWTTLLLRICMMKTANMLAQKIAAQCIITGESLGQVASQTIDNMTVTEHFCQYPLLRPLVGLDKEEIISTARFIGTYDTSILPYEDCCVLFSPRHPVLYGSVPEAEKIYENLEIDELITEAFEKREIKGFSAPHTIEAHFSDVQK